MFHLLVRLLPHINSARVDTSESSSSRRCFPLFPFAVSLFSFVSPRSLCCCYLSNTVIDIAYRMSPLSSSDNLRRRFPALLPPSDRKSTYRRLHRPSLDLRHPLGIHRRTTPVTRVISPPRRPSVARRGC